VSIVTLTSVDLLKIQGDQADKKCSKGENMKLKITLKSPDAVWDSLVAAGLDPNNLDETPEINAAFLKYVEFMEYVTIEIDTDTGTARVLEVE